MLEVAYSMLHVTGCVTEGRSHCEACATAICVLVRFSSEAELDAFKGALVQRYPTASWTRYIQLHSAWIKVTASSTVTLHYWRGHTTIWLSGDAISSSPWSSSRLHFSIFLLTTCEYDSKKTASSSWSRHCRCGCLEMPLRCGTTAMTSHCYVSKLVPQSPQHSQQVPRMSQCVWLFALTRAVFTSAPFTAAGLGL